MIKPVEFKDNKLIILDQTLLPGEERYIELRSLEEVFDAIKKSTKLAFLNLGLSIKLMFVEFLLLFRFLITWALIVGLPLGLVYLSVWLNILDNRFVEWLIRVIAGILLLILSYINCIVETFFLTYWYQAYQMISKKEE